MIWEVAGALLLAVAALWMVLGPILRDRPPAPRAWEPPEPEETPRGQAVAALREIELDRATGKLSDTDYAELKERYTLQAIAAMRAESQPASASSAPLDLEAIIAARARAHAGAPAPVCQVCGPRPEPDAVFCSNCGHALSASTATAAATATPS